MLNYNSNTGKGVINKYLKKNIKLYLKVNQASNAFQHIRYYSMESLTVHKGINKDLANSFK